MVDWYVLSLLYKYLPQRSCSNLYFNVIPLHFNMDLDFTQVISLSQTVIQTFSCLGKGERWRLPDAHDNLYVCRHLLISQSFDYLWRVEVIISSKQYNMCKMCKNWVIKKIQPFLACFLCQALNLLIRPCQIDMAMSIISQCNVFPMFFYAAGCWMIFLQFWHVWTGKWAGEFIWTANRCRSPNTPSPRHSSSSTSEPTGPAAMQQWYQNFSCGCDSVCLKVYVWYSICDSMILIVNIFMLHGGADVSWQNKQY